MIVPMKKVTLLCLESDKQIALEQLRELGVMHVLPLPKLTSDDVATYTKNITDAEHVLGIFASREAPKGAMPSEMSGGEVVQRILDLMNSEARVSKELDQLRRDYEKLSPWGDFSFASIQELEKKGVHVYLCAVPRDRKPEAPEGVMLSVINSDASGIYYVLFSSAELDSSALPLVSLPQISLSELQFEIQKEEHELTEMELEINRLSASKFQVEEYREQQNARLEFAVNHESMVAGGSIAHLEGYVPVTAVETIRGAALVHGWALLLEDPASDDMNVPTLISKPKWMSFIDPLFDFIGVTPGYRESDVNLFFIVFFPIFFGLIIGDAAYGVLFIVTALICKYTCLRGKESARLPLNLFLILSCTSLIWGWLNGSWFGISRSVLPGFLQGMDFFADPSLSPTAVDLAERLHIEPVSLMKDKIVQYLCFLLAGLHLSLARIVRFLGDVRHTWRAFGNIGWALLIWANFFMAVSLIVFPGTFPMFGYYFYGIGVLLIVVTITGEAALNLPFALIGSFVDVLSYIRLFAVGLSGAYIALNFNRMGGMLLDAVPDSLYILGLIGLVVVAIFGHILNISLGFLGVLVHAIRLNTLEFSNHIEMQWTGKRYRPFAKNNIETK